MDKQKIFHKRTSLPIYNDLADMNLDFHMDINTQTSASKHYHWFLEMGYVLEGRANHQWNDDNGIIEEGSYYIIGHMSPHSYMATSKNLKIMNIMFNPAFFDESLLGAKTFFDILASKCINFNVNLFSIKPTPFTFTDKNGTVKKLIMEMYEEYQSQNKGYLEVIRSKMIEIIIKSIRPLYINIPYSSKGKTDTFFKVIQYVNDNYMNPVTLSEICVISNYTVPYMSRKFKSTFGITFWEYVTQLRITAARRYLANTGKTIDEIMDLVGYKDKKSFYAAFKKISGTTPDAYRRKKKM